jgi:glutaredoxin
VGIVPPAPPPLPLRLCPRHGLVAGRDGRCIICRRNDDEGDASRVSRRVLVGLILPIVLACGVLVWKGTSATRRPPVALRSEPSGTVLARAAPAVPAADEGPAPRADDATRAAIHADEERARQRTIEEEMHKVRIRMFVTNTCEMCDVARDWLKKQGLPCSEINVDDGPDALAEMRRITPSQQVPVFDVEGLVLVGFGPNNVLGAVRRAADRHTRFAP